ncbi:MAG: AIPR family protein [Parasphingorhabdus sp.]
MTIELNEFHQDFFQEIVSSADADGHYTEDAFFERFSEYLIDAGELETADRAPYNPARGGLRVDGYGGDPLTSDGILSLIVADFSQSQEVETLTATEMDNIFKRVSNFLVKSLDKRFRDSLEETDPAFGLADLIAKRWKAISKVRLFLVSNRVLSSRVDGREAGEIEGLPVTYNVWDLGRLYRYASSGFEREEIVVDLENEFGGPLPVLPAHLNDAGYEAYLVVVPASQLAAIYDRWGARLLEQNVRVFLQARGNVNKGIRNTIENDPEMFFAYNNGITATAEGLETRKENDGLVITGLQNLQIVNGGQTTASIYAASRKKDVDLSRVFVQMKLSIVESDRALDVVPKISEFANSQNRVNAADFFANHPFHVRMEEFSRRIFAPSPDGTFRESKWFYERARGQYLDARGLKTDAQRKKFDLEYPRAHLISKTDLAKFLYSWEGHPDIVSKGAQKNFAEFAKAIGRQWTKQPDAINEMFYRQSIAKAIVFKQTEKIVSAQPWYQGGGIRSRVVPYAIAKLVHDAKQKDRHVNLEDVWRTQGLPNRLAEALTISSKAVHDIISGVATEIPNPMEWAKQQACWNRAKELKVDWPEGWFESLSTEDDQKETRRSAVKDQRMLNGIEAQTLVVRAGPEFWRETKAWGTAKRLLTATESGILDVAASVPARIPSEKQSLRAVETLRKLHVEGFQNGLDLVP